MSNSIELSGIFSRGYGIIPKALMETADQNIIKAELQKSFELPMQKAAKLALGGQSEVNKNFVLGYSMTAASNLMTKLTTDPKKDITDGAFERLS